MKRIYIKPESDVVKVNLINSVLDEEMVVTDSTDSTSPTNAAAKGSFLPDDEVDDNANSAPHSQNIWDD